MALNRLNPRLRQLTQTKIKVLDTKAGTTERIRGRAWMSTRQRIQQRDMCTCRACGLVRMDHEVDHIVPLEQGGSNDDANMQLLCSGPGRCHARKSASEAKQRFGK